MNNTDGAKPVGPCTACFSGGVRKLVWISVPARALSIAALVAFLTGTLVAQTQAMQSAVRKGQSLTMLPSGLILLAGGYDKSEVPTAGIAVADGSGNISPLGITMQYPRAGHTATVLPDGRVLIFGGYGADGKLVSTGEMLDPVTRKIIALTDFRVLPRAFHTATVLTDGTLVVIGGVGTGGELKDDVQVWDYRAGTTFAYHAALSVPRQQQIATLLPNGNVQISGGLDRFGKPVDVAEEYDIARHSFSVSSSAVSTPPTPAVADSIPVDGATNVRITDILAVRFEGTMSVTSLNSERVSLQDSAGNTVLTTVTAAEAGRLVFVIPSSPLQFGMSYILTLEGVLDNNQEQLATKSIQFTTLPDSQDSSDEEWVPGPEDFNGQWHSHTGPSEWQKLAPLRAAAGVTALSGQVLRLNGRPLAHVSLQIDGRSGFSDSTGRFLISNIHGGHHVLLIDGRPSNRTGVVYGVYEVGVNIAAGTTNVLNYTIWMTKLDMAHAANIPSPTIAEDTVVTSPRLPGLQLHLPRNTVIIDHDGRAVRQLTITPVPLDKPPFPLPPGVQVPIYFTIQPGGAYIDVKGLQTSAKGARLIYPNPYHSHPGTEFNFWNYDADSKGWYVYGHGKVSTTGQSVIPDPGVVVYEFTGAMVGNAGGPFPFPPNKPPCHASSSGNDGDPVDLSTGLFIYSKTDLAVSDVIPLELRRTYRNNDNVSRAFGIGASFNYDMYMTGDQHPYTYQELISPDGSRIRFNRISPGDSFSDAVYTHTSGQDEFYGAALNYGLNNSFGASWAISKKDGTQLWFPDSDSIPDYRLATPVGVTDRYGNAINFERDSNGNLRQVTSPNGRYIQFTYDASNRIIVATDNIGRSVHYSYDGPGRLESVQDTRGGITRYTYDDQNNMLTIQDARGITYLTNVYDAEGKVIKQTLANGGTYLFNWTETQNTSEIFTITAPNGDGTFTTQTFRTCGLCSEGYTPVISQVEVTDPRGYVRRVTFDSMGRKSTDIMAVGQPEQQVYTYQYNADNTLRSLSSPLQHETTYTYDAKLNVTDVNQLTESGSPISTTITYDPQYSQMTSVTDSRGITTTVVPDGQGNTAQVTDPLGHSTVATYNADGTTATYTDAAGESLQFAYDNGDLVSILDPMGSKTLRFVDGAGRVLALTDRAGRQTQYQYDDADEVTQSVDTAGNKVSFTYDPNGNVLSITDAQNHTTSFTYDSMDQVLTRTDPLQRQESYSYDLAGNLLTYTDRKGQVTANSYDALGRLTLVGFGAQVNGAATTYSSTIAYQYDAGNRMTTATDSIAGVISRRYDASGNLLSETTPQGGISYTHDAAGRRTSMQVAGQLPVAYTYDDADRVIQISQGSSAVTFTYDNANRRSTTTLPNGIVESYSYDQNSNLTGIVYSLNGATLGDLTYTYDSLGRRMSMGGSFASTRFPSAVSSALYDSANELTSWNGNSISYDANGNMLNDGIHSYAWDSRDHLSSIDSGSTGSFIYDAFGRRAAKTMLGTMRTFVYDHSNPIQELSGTTPIANMLTGGVDEIFTRTDDTGTLNFLSSAVGSTLALTDSTGAIQTIYNYDPFGNTSSSGAPTSNSFAYTGRENDGTGLYYYRARYYSPALQRFISEDPIGFVGGKNFYEYALGQPVVSGDPSGLWAPAAHDAIFDYALGGCAPKSYIDAIKQDSRDFDERTGTATEWDFAHSMMKPDQSLQSFYNDRANWINSQMQNAEALEQAGDVTDALNALAEAMHTVSDAYSPMHMKGGPNGIPYVWDCGWTHPFRCVYPGPNKPMSNNLRHIPVPILGGETKQVWEDSPQSVKDDLRLDLLNAYKAVFGKCTYNPGRKD